METRFLVHSASNIVQKLFDFSGAAQVARDFALKLYLSKRKKRGGGEIWMEMQNSDAIGVELQFQGDSIAFFT